MLFLLVIASAAQATSSTFTAEAPVSGATTSTGYPITTTGTPSFSPLPVFTVFPSVDDWLTWEALTGVYDDVINSSRIIDFGNGVAQDLATGLQWQTQDSVVNNLTSARDPEWTAAHCAAQTTGGYHDWRLPSVAELITISITAALTTPPYTQLPLFNPSSQALISGSPNVQQYQGEQWWVVDPGVTCTYSMNSYCSYDGNTIGIRCVRASSRALVSPGTRYANLDGGPLTAAQEVVYDMLTGLVWERSFVDNVEHLNAGEHCASLTLGNRSWRMPTIRELSTIIFRDLPTVFDPVAFPTNPTSGGLWASTMSTIRNAYWAVRFDFPGLFPTSLFTAYGVRCVSGLVSANATSAPSTSVASSVPSSTPAQLTPVPVVVATKHMVLSGQQWATVLAQDEAAVREAVRSDIALATSLAPDKVEILALMVGSLIVDFAILNTDISPSALQSALQNADLPSLKDLYQTVVHPGSEDTVALQSVSDVTLSSATSRGWFTTVLVIGLAYFLPPT
jgi:hypothetical protein